MAVDALTEKKLRITSAAAAGQVVVVQDGSAADATATIKIDDGFENGYDTGLAIDGSALRVVFDLEEIESSRTGKTFTFSVQDHLNRNSLALGPGDKVEFWATNAAAPTAFGGTFPAWHSANLGAVQSLLFFGFITDVKRIERTGGYAAFRVTCADAIQRANVIKLQQSKPNDVTIPWVVFNVDAVDDADWFIAIKKYDAASSDPAIKYGYGWPKDTTAARLTLTEVLEYLQSAYQADLYDRGIIAGASDDLFDATEIAQFSSIYPPKTVFENTGFGTAVRSLIAANAPDFDVFVDPRSRQWRFVPTARDIVAGGFATIDSVVTPGEKFKCDDVSMFATSGTGSTVRMQSSTDPRASEVVDVAAVNTGTSEITLATPTAYTYAAGDLILPMYAWDNRPPAVEIDLEDDCRDNDLSVDLRSVYTAVSIVGRRQKTETVQVSQTADATWKWRLGKAYDTAFEANYRPHAHDNRRADRGADGLGIVIYQIETIGSGADAFTRLYFSERTSLYGNDHDVTDNTLGQAEWTGAAFHLLTYAAGVTNCEGQSISATVAKFARSGWIDSAETIRRFRIDLDRDLLATVPAIKGEQTHSTTGDRFELTSSEIFKPANPNKRWLVGAAWKIENTTAADEARWLDADGCPPEVAFTGQNNQVTTLSAAPIERTTDAPRTFDELVKYAGITNPGIDGAPRVWLIKPPDPPPTFEQLCAKLPPPDFTPRTFTMTQKHFTHTVLEARSPAAGFMGTAWLWHKHAEVLQLVSDRFEDESQTEQFGLIAEAIRARVSEPHYYGSLSLVGLTRWFPLIDLGFRVTFGGGDTGIVSGVVTEQRRFWGLVQTIRYSLKEGTVSLSFESSGFAESINRDLFERQFVSETAEMKAIKANLERLQKTVNCVIARPPARTPQVTQGCNVSHSSQSVVRKTTTIDPKQIATGLGETSLGAPTMSAGAISGDPASNAGSFAFHPQFVVERNYLGKAFGIVVPSGTIIGGTESAGRFIPSATIPGDPIGLPQHTADSVNEIALAILGVDLLTPKGSTLVETGAGSTTTVIQLAAAIPDDGRFVGGFIEFRAGSVARPPYTIASHTAYSVTLTGAMSEAAPGVGMAATLWAARLPTLNPIDFPDGGRMLKDRTGAYFVATKGRLIPATLAGTTLSKASSTTAPDLGVVTKKAFDGIVIDHEVWIDCSANPSFDGGSGTIAATNPSQTAATTYNQDLSIYYMLDGSKRGNLIQFRFPTDLDETSPVSLVAVYRLSGAVGATPNVEIGVDMITTPPFKAPSVGTTAAVKTVKSMDTLGAVSGEIVMHDCGNIYSAATGFSGALLHGMVYRDAAGAGDNYTGTLHMIGVTLRMKRRIGGSDSNGNRLGGEDGEDTARFLMAG